MTGYIVLHNGVVIAWHSQRQKIVTLSVTETKYSEIMEVSCEILFMRVIFFLMEVVVEYHITVYVDNIEAILLPDNTPVPKWAKNVDTGHHLIRD